MLLHSSCPYQRCLRSKQSVTFLCQNYDENESQHAAQDLIELTEHCLKTFTFEGITYEQIKGTPMGFQISGFVAEVVLRKLERRLFREYELKFRHAALTALS
uniref:Uncharacterized protein n=1 Tax=Schistocephalus solidus TaxID=70667 RepID=A0A0V0J9P3_SCHSO